MKCRNISSRQLNYYLSQKSPDRCYFRDNYVKDETIVATFSLNIAIASGQPACEQL